VAVVHEPTGRQGMAEVSQYATAGRRDYGRFKVTVGKKA
jgi:hypothetical protein